MLLFTVTLQGNDIHHSALCSLPVGQAGACWWGHSGWSCHQHQLTAYTATSLEQRATSSALPPAGERPVLHIGSLQEINPRNCVKNKCQKKCWMTKYIYSRTVLKYNYFCSTTNQSKILYFYHHIYFNLISFWLLCAGFRILVYNLCWSFYTSISSGLDYYSNSLSSQFYIILD